MSISIKRRPRMAVMLVALCALGSARLISPLVQFWRQPARAAEAPERFMTRFEPLAALLPPGQVTGYLFDEAHANLGLMHPDNRFYLAQYALVPHLVDRTPAHRLVIVDSDSPTATPEMALREHWTLVADLRQGVKLFRTRRED
jgi:hypothetical protein